MENHDVERAILERVAAHWHDWRPDRDLPSPLRLHLLADRPGARLYVVRCGGSVPPAGILAKVRTGGSAPAVSSEASRRPTLTARPLGDADATTREYQGLASIMAALGEVDEQFRSVRPLALLPEHNTILMDFLPGRTLRDHLVARSRLVPSALASDRLDLAEPWHRVGLWLRRYQESTPLEGLVARHTSRQEVVDQFHAYDAFLGARLGSARFPALGRRGAQLAEAVLPEQLELAVGHHDFAARNVLLGVDGRLSVIDPLWRWAVPAQEDLCRFLVGVRLLGIQVHAHGLAFGTEEIDRLHDSAIHGYYGDRVPWEQLRCYEALILLDKWAALVAAGERRAVKARTLGLSLRFASRYVAGQVHRVLDAGENVWS